MILVTFHKCSTVLLNGYMPNDCVVTFYDNF